MKTNTNRLRGVVAVLALCLAVAGAAKVVASPPAEQVIKVTVRKFAFVPDGITLKVGVPVILEFTPAEVLMGFNVPDFGVRTDIVPGKVTRLRVVPTKTGSFVFFCDIFCGSGHAEMTGTITVVA